MNMHIFVHTIVYFQCRVDFFVAFALHRLFFSFINVLVIICHVFAVGMLPVNRLTDYPVLEA